MEEFVNFENISVPRFNGKNYEKWKIKFMELLKSRDYTEQALRRKTKQDGYMEWLEKDQNAKTLLYKTITYRRIFDLHDCNTFFEMMRKFEKMYGKKTEIEKAESRANVSNLENICEFTEEATKVNESTSKNTKEKEESKNLFKEVEFQKSEKVVKNNEFNKVNFKLKENYIDKKNKESELNLNIEVTYNDSNKVTDLSLIHI